MKRKHGRIHITSHEERARKKKEMGEFFCTTHTHAHIQGHTHTHTHCRTFLPSFKIFSFAKSNASLTSFAPSPMYI
jgi:hypothetical protein